jgi:hypothetical protein
MIATHTGSLCARSAATRFGPTTLRSGAQRRETGKWAGICAGLVLSPAYFACKSVTDAGAGRVSATVRCERSAGIQDLGLQVRIRWIRRIPKHSLVVVPQNVSHIPTRDRASSGSAFRSWSQITPSRCDAARHVTIPCPTRFDSIGPLSRHMVVIVRDNVPADSRANRRGS